MITNHGIAALLPRHSVERAEQLCCLLPWRACRLGGRATHDLRFVILNNKQTMIFYNSLKLTDKPKNEVNFEEFLLKK